MISNRYSFSDFLKSLDMEGKDHLDIIYLAEQEATKAERLLYRANKLMSIPLQEVEKYAETVKHFISFMRYGIKPAGVDDEDFELFRSVCVELAEKGRFQGRCFGLH